MLFEFSIKSIKLRKQKWHSLDFKFCELKCKQKKEKEAEGEKSYLNLYISVEL